jgi:hypothetical protein
VTGRVRLRSLLVHLLTGGNVDQLCHDNGLPVLVGVDGGR